MKFAVFNSSGLPVAFYSPDISYGIPDDAVEITDTQWLELICNPLARRWDGSSVVHYTPPSEPPSPPPSITRRQCALEMHGRGLITDAEAVAMAATATPPALVETLISALATADQVAARIDFAATSYERANPLLTALMSAQGASAADIDTFFRAAAAR